MTNDEFLSFLKDYLRLDIKTHTGYYGERSVEIVLQVDGEEVSSIYLDVPSPCSCTCSQTY